MKFSIVLMLLLFTIPFALAEIEDATITIKIYNDTYPGNISIEIINSDYLGDTETYTFQLNMSDEGFPRLNECFDFSFIVDTENPLPTNWSYHELYNETNELLTICKIQRGQFETQLNSCLFRLGEYEGGNATKCHEELFNCRVTSEGKDSKIESKNKEITELNDEKEDTKNSKIFWGIAGVVIGILGVLAYRGELGGEKARDKSEGEWNKRQTG